ncbi:lupus La protein [Pantherophis guttatus]|uniref:Lupus La protein n=1 Tax=Pantherophis guttatus TaxID=94885 RepID=A0A6P9CTG5_PANGU|nr:lupus La protein [Pantherophis guttatus]XP_034282988.1 lupus La protein [Pantherophis guttatus]
MAENGDSENMSDLEKKVCQQIEYYFGDHNLPRDKFLQEKIKSDDGWVTLETIIKFNRLNRLTKDFDVIVGALKKSKTELMEVSEDKTKIRRSPDKPLPEVTEQYKNAIKSRSIYIKGFPLDATLDDIKEWLDCKGKVENIQMRRTLQKTFKGSIFAVFDTVESAKEFVGTPNQRYKDTELIVLFKEDYFAKKNDEKKRNKLEAKAKAKLEKEEKQKHAEETEMKYLAEKQGCLLKFFGDLEDHTCREDLHAVFSNHGEIKWIDFVRGAKEGIILFKSSAKGALDKAKEANNGKLQLREKDVTWEVLEGDVAKEALKKIMESQQELLNKKRGKGRKGKGKGGKGAQDTQDKKVKFQGKKTKFESEDEEEGEDANTTGSASPKKRPLEEDKQEEPAAKQLKTENGAGIQL